jgi:hypothetical protein
MSSKPVISENEKPLAMNPKISDSRGDNPVGTREIFGRGARALEFLEKSARDDRCDRRTTGAQFADRTNKFRRQAVFQQITRRPGLDAGKHMLFVAEDGDHHDVRPGIVLPHLANDLNSARVGKAKIHQQDVWSCLELDWLGLFAPTPHRSR